MAKYIIPTLKQLALYTSFSQQKVNGIYDYSKSLRQETSADHALLDEIAGDGQYMPSPPLESEPKDDELLEYYRHPNMFNFWSSRYDLFNNLFKVVSRAESTIQDIVKELLKISNSFGEDADLVVKVKNLVDGLNEVGFDNSEKDLEVVELPPRPRRVAS